MLASKQLLYLSFWCWVLLSLLGPVRSTDVWWHLACGRYILAHHQVPSVDVFSLTCRGRPWINIEWLYQVALYAAYRLGGFFAIAAMKTALIAAALAFLMLRLQRAGLPDLGICIGAMVVFAACGPGWSERADLISVSLVSALMLSLEGVRHGRASPRRLLYWIAIFFLWANTHPGFIVGLGIAGLYAIEFIRIRRITALQATVGLALILVTTLATPPGVSLWKEIMHCLSMMPADIVEYLPPPWPHMSIFWMALLLFALLWARAVERKANLPWLGWVLTLIFGYAAVRHARFVPFFMFAAFPFAMESTFARPGWPSFGRLTRAVLTGWINLFFILMAVAQWPRISFGALRSQTPIDVCDFIAAHRWGGRFFNDYEFGSYWIWRFNGDPAVFIDGRYLTVDGYSLLNAEIQRAQHGSPGDWQKFLDRYDITAVVTRVPEPAVRGMVFSSYFPKSRWALVYSDNLALLFLRRDAYSALRLAAKNPAL